MNEALRKICETIEGYRDQAIELQRELCARPALAPENGGEGEKARADFLLALLRDWPLERLDTYNAPDERVPCGYRPNIVAVLPGTRTDCTLWIMSHMDVVPPGDLSLWSGDPWTLRVDGDRLIGRGTEDNQQGLVGSLLTVKAFIECGIQPSLNIGLLLVADEETGSRYGVQYLLKEAAHLFKQDDLYVIPDAGNASGTMIEVAEKSILWLKFVVHGVQTHGSTPHEGKNAHKAGAELIVRLNALYDAFSAQDSLFDPPCSTFEPTKKEANVPNINTIPGEDVFYFDCRILPAYELRDVWKVVRDHVRFIEEKHGVTVEVTSAQEVPSAPPTSPDAAIVQALKKAVYELRGKTCNPLGIGGGTVASFFRNAGFPAAVWSTIEERAHEPDEYCLLSNLLADACVFAHIALHAP